MTGLYNNGTSVCIGTGSGVTWQDINVYPCSTARKNVWTVDLKGRIISNRFPNHCLGLTETNELKLLHCWTVAKDMSWLFTTREQIRYGGSSFYVSMTEDIQGDDNLQIAPLIKSSNDTSITNWSKTSLATFQNSPSFSFSPSDCSIERSFKKKNGKVRSCSKLLKMGNKRRSLHCEEGTGSKDCSVSPDNEFLLYFRFLF